MLERALRRAAQWHATQVRKGLGQVPYVEHVVGVALILDRLGLGEEVVIAGLLHDAVEDTDATLEQIASEFGPAIARIVADCSERKTDPSGAKRPWIDRKTDHLAHLERAPVASRAVALADKLHNLTSILVDLDVHPDLWGLFNADRERVLWYYRSAIERLPGSDPVLERLAVECAAVLAAIEAQIAPRPPSAS